VKEYDPQVATRPITVKYETVCAECAGKVLKGEEAVWYSAHDKVEELRPERRIVCRACEPAKPRAGQASCRAGEGKSFGDYLQRHKGLRRKTA
jgi:hypothetical protein